MYSPCQVEAVVPVLDKGLIGKTFKKEAKDVQDALAALSLEDLQVLDDTLGGGKDYQLPGKGFWGTGPDPEWGNMTYQA